MRVPLSWLKEYVDIKIPTRELADRITLAGLEVASIETTGQWWDPKNILVGQVISVTKHPNADRLALVEVDCGDRHERVVAGAPNLFFYKDAAKLPVLKVAFAKTGAVLVDAYSKDEPRPKKTLKAAKIRGIESCGMVCSERELGLSDQHEGILMLPEDAPVGVPLRDYLGDEILEIEITTDMARALSMIGIAKEVAALTQAELHFPPDKWYADGKDKAADYLTVSVENPELCSRYIGVVIRDVKIGASPSWIQERLRKVGVRPINNVVDITNYVMFEYGQPLHAFDYDKILARNGGKNPTITVRTSRRGEKMTTLDKVERELDDTMLVIADAVGPVALAGVMGGIDTEVGADTHNILLESATFNNINNRRTSQRLKLSSESSYRFTRGVPATLNAVAARRASELMRKHCEGRIVPKLAEDYPVKQKTRVIYTAESEVRRQLGVEISLDMIIAALKKYDFNVEIISSLKAPPSRLGKSAFGLHVEPEEALLKCTVPWERLDVEIPADITEEIARIIGYEKIESTMPADALPGHVVNPVLETEDKIRDILVGCGLTENINYALTTVENHRKMRLVEENTPFVELANPLTSSRKVMRRSLLVSAVENLSYNSRFTGRFANFEIGRVYLPEAGKEKRPCEERRLCLIVAGPRRLSSVYKDPAGAEEFDFFDVKGILEALFSALKIERTDVEFKLNSGSKTFGPRCADISFKGTSLGIIGEIHPEIRRELEFSGQAIYLAEVAIDPLVRPSWQLEVLPPISSYPPVVEDLALVVSEEVTAAQLLHSICRAGKPLVADIELFDIYRGKPLAAGKKSLAYRLTYQSRESTLSDTQVEKVRKTILAEVSKNLGAELRPQ